jgi:hypothetical protein
MNNDILSKFFGKNDLKIDFMILCPINTLYYKLCSRLNGIVCKAGFFEYLIIKNNLCFLKGNGILVSSPQGWSCADLIYASPAKRVLLVGYAGGISSKVAIGEVVEVVEAIDENKHFIGYPLGNFKKVVASYSPCLLGQFAELGVQKATKLCADVIDMETLPCFYAADIKGIFFSSLLCITDLPQKEPFYKINDISIRNIEVGIEILLSCLGV